MMKLGGQELNLHLLYKRVRTLNALSGILLPGVVQYQCHCDGFGEGSELRNVLQLWGRCI